VRRQREGSAHGLVHAAADHASGVVVRRENVLHESSEDPEGLLLGEVHEQQSRHEVHGLAVAHDSVADRVGEEDVLEREDVLVTRLVGERDEGAVKVLHDVMGGSRGRQQR
jgi:hypothetical protein